MFDPQTTELIHRAPQLEGLDLERLPQELTKAFTSIVAARVRLQQDAPLPGELLPLVRRFRRLASTFETMVAVSPQRENRASAAYVSAQAHHLLHLARGFEAGVQEGQEHLRADSISPEVSALLLFLIADQPSDAMDMAKIISDRPMIGGEVQIALTRALCALARGDLDEIAVNPVSLFSIGDDYIEAASPVLYFQLLGALRLLAVRLLLGTAAPTATQGATEMFRAVQQISIEAVDLPAITGDGFEFIALQTEESRFTALNTFLGPHHLATLLVSAGDHLLECATSSTSPPLGVSPQSWQKILPRIVSQRPYLWRNHQKAIKDGLLSIGTSAVVSFPTGAGKSTLSELKAAAALAAGKSVLYLAPTHALVAQVQRCFRYSFRGIPVGSSRIYDDAYAEIEDQLPNVAIMTPERCLALLTLQEDVFDDFGLIVFDECHLLHPKARGHNRRSLDVLLCILNLAKTLPHADWLFLSAMMENATDIAGWVEHYTGKKCLALNLDWKPTRQARGCVVYRSTEIVALRGHLRSLEPKARKANGRLSAPNASVHKSLNATPHGFFCLRQTWQTLESEDYSLVEFANTGIQLSASLTTTKTHWRLMPNKNYVAAQISALFAERLLKVLIFAQTKDHTDSIARDASSRIRAQVQSSLRQNLSS